MYVKVIHFCIINPFAAETLKSSIVIVLLYISLANLLNYEMNMGWNKFVLDFGDLYNWINVKLDYVILTA